MRSPDVWISRRRDACDALSSPSVVWRRRCGIGSLMRGESIRPAALSSEPSHDRTTRSALHDNVGRRGFPSSRGDWVSRTKRRKHSLLYAVEKRLCAEPSSARLIDTICSEVAGRQMRDSVWPTGATEMWIYVTVRKLPAVRLQASRYPRWVVTGFK